MIRRSAILGFAALTILTAFASNSYAASANGGNGAYSLAAKKKPKPTPGCCEKNGWKEPCIICTR